MCYTINIPCDFYVISFCIFFAVYVCVCMCWFLCKEDQDQTENIFEMDRMASPEFIPMTRPQRLQLFSNPPQIDLPQFELPQINPTQINLPTRGTNELQNFQLTSNNSQLLDLNNSQSVPPNIQENPPLTPFNLSTSNLPSTSDLPPSYSCLTLCTNPLEALPPSYSQCNLSCID